MTSNRGRGRYAVHPDLCMWKVYDRETGRVMAVAFSRRIAYLIRRHLCEVLP